MKRKQACHDPVSPHRIQRGIEPSLDSPNRRSSPHRAASLWLSGALALVLGSLLPILQADHIDNPPLDGGMVHYMLTYSYGDLIPDETINDHHADMVGDHLSFEQVDGVTALRIDGLSLVRTPSVYALDHLNEGTHSLSIWFKPDHLPGENGTSNNFAILMKGSLFGIRLNADGRFYAHFYQDVDGSTVISSPQYQDWNKWYHLCQVVDYDEGEVRFYVDGHEVGSDAINANYSHSNTSTRWIIGYASVGRNHWSARGNFWEARIYDHALSPADIVEIYIGTSEIDTDGDGIPDSWKLYYFGTTNVDADDDADGDGLTNLEEYLAGTNPLNPDTNQNGIWDSIAIRLGMDPTFIDSTPSGNPASITLTSPKEADLIP